ncbi:tRNA(m5U54)methyltransferase [Orbilia ellipsospora]|uniref:tRNA(M5U54)methyltransferase n=1 Tax=Orbilia ellipsospora TaxID=2528407 RepID=A0AAV9XF94_9PEZI
MNPRLVAYSRQLHCYLVPSHLNQHLLLQSYNSPVHLIRDFARIYMSGAKRANELSSFPRLLDNRQPRKKKKTANTQRSEGSIDDVRLHDIQWLLQESRPNNFEPPLEVEPLPPLLTQIELSITMLSSTGDGLAVSEDLLRVYVVPFSVPGDKVLAKVVKHFPSHSTTDLLEVKVPSKDRQDDLVFCKYFGKCSGCQFQMLSDDYQRNHKHKVIEKAMANFSNLDPSLIPPIGEIMPSPISQGYRTKLTPHFDGPRRGGFKPDAPTPDIGFQMTGRHFVLDIEDCPIGTEIVRTGLKSQRKYVRDNLQTFKRGATLLLRESTERNISSIDPNASLPPYKELKTCVTNSKDFVTEWVGAFKFTYPAGAFFQNNNSILLNFTNFVREQLYVPPTSDHRGESTDAYLIDAYCGSGLFSICCGHKFKSVMGIDISSQSIESARKNAEENGIYNAKFITGNAEALFADVDFPPDKTSVVIDPPRKGCDELFLDQLLKLAPRRIVYISCNVHTMARDVGWILQHATGNNYMIEKLGGFDFFPQTHHVEGYAVLSKST